MIDGPAVSRLSLYGVIYAVDLEVCRVRMLERVAELRKDGDRGGMQLIAEAAGVDRATLRRFFEGQRLTVESFTAIVTKGLQLDLQIVAKREPVAV